MSNYKIICDEYHLKDFIAWLPELLPHEIYYLALFARKKYSPELKHSKTDKTQLKRFTSDKTRMFEKIKQLECEIGSYRLKDVVAPQESLALYVTVNPRSQILAAKGALRKLVDLATNPYNNWNVHQEVMSEIQKAKSRTCWVDFDIDLDMQTYLNQNNLESDFLNKFAQIKNQIVQGDVLAPSSCIKLLQTHSGYHILINPNARDQLFCVNDWYKIITKTFIVDQSGDNMIPVVGCTQGGFMPYFIV